MAKEKGLHKWLIEPLDEKGVTNEILSKAQPFLSVIGMLEGVICDKGQRHNLWHVVGYCDVTKLREKQKEDSRIQFQVWCQDGNGVIRVWNCPTKERRGGMQDLFPASQLRSSKHFGWKERRRRLTYRHMARAQMKPI
jgi:hypothetical protein